MVKLTNVVLPISSSSSDVKILLDNGEMLVTGILTSVSWHTDHLTGLTLNGQSVTYRSSLPEATLEFLVQSVEIRPEHEEWF